MYILLVRRGQDILNYCHVLGYLGIFSTCYNHAFTY